MEADGSTTVLAPVQEGNPKKCVFSELVDFDGEEALPVSSRYRIDRVNSSGTLTQILDWTSITAVDDPETGITITVTVNSLQNRFTTADHAYEKRRVSIEALYTAVTDLFEDWCEYDVIGNPSYPTIP